MHLAQKRAIFGMVDSIESQLRFLKSMILMDEQHDDQTAQHVPRGVVDRSTPGGDQYLSIAQEKELAARMEQARLDGMAEEADIKRAWAKQNEDMASDNYEVM